ncbi:MAG: TIGR01777 family protein [Elusimicrobia bacterium]|nr:TIGR01777 family protein [Elusimicrobiota bacterium]
MKIILAGGTGFIGQAISARLVGAGHEAVVLTRSRCPALPAGARAASWDPPKPGPWEAEFDAADAVINLAGTPIAAGRWTEKRKLRILQSRICATRAVVMAAGKAARRPKTLVNASAVGYYGDVPEGDAAEEHPRGSGFLADVCACWEEAASQAADFGLRVALLRTGIVLGRDSGALSRMLPPFKLFIGGPLGSGRQWMPWIHRQDAVEAVLFLLENPVSGPVNLAAPHPARMEEFCRALGRALGRPSFVRVPAFALQLLIGEMAEILLTGQRAVPKKLVGAGFKFRYPELDAALADILA